VTILSQIVKVTKVLVSELLDKPWVRWIKVEFHDNVIGIVFISSALFLALDFEWTSKVTGYVEDLSVEKDKIIRGASVWEDNGVDSLFLNLSNGVGVIKRVGSVEGVDIVLSAGEGVVAVLVDGGITVLRLEVWPVFAVLWAGTSPLRLLHTIILADGEVVRSTADLNISFEEATTDSLSVRDWERKPVCQSEVLAFDGDGSSGILVLDSEGPVD